MLEPVDVLAVQDVLSTYSHVVDDRAWERLGDVFASDAVFDATAYGGGVSEGLAALRRRWERTPPARLHHHTDTLVYQDDDGTVRARSKGISVFDDGSVAAGVYRDVLRRSEVGWRIVRRVAAPLTATTDTPAP
jgi:hypothetical protein